MAVHTRFGDEPVETGAFIHFIEMRKRAAGIQFAPLLIEDRRPLDIIEQPFHQIRRRRQVFQPLLILDSDGIASELVRNPHGGNVHLALFENLLVGQIGFFIRPGHELDATLVEPGANLLRLGIGNLAHRGHQRRLAQAFLIDARWIQQIVLDDSVVHAHASFIEDAKDGFARLQDAQQARVSELPFSLRQTGEIEPVDVTGIVIDLVLFEPLPQPAEEEFIVEILAPYRAEPQLRPCAGSH